MVCRLVERMRASQGNAGSESETSPFINSGRRAGGGPVVKCLSCCCRVSCLACCGVPFVLFCAGGRLLAQGGLAELLQADQLSAQRAAGLVFQGSVTRPRDGIVREGIKAARMTSVVKREHRSVAAAGCRAGFLGPAFSGRLRLRRDA